MPANSSEPSQVHCWFQSIECRPHGGLLQTTLFPWSQFSDTDLLIQPVLTIVVLILIDHRLSYCPA